MAIEKLMCYLIGHTTRSNKTLLSAIWEKGLVILGASSVGNQQKWDTLGPERSAGWNRLGELLEGPIEKSVGNQQDWGCDEAVAELLSGHNTLGGRCQGAHSSAGSTDHAQGNTPVPL